MTAWLEFALSNALASTLLALVALVVARVSRRPQWAFAAWMLVLVKLLVPGVWNVPLASVREVAEVPEVAQRAAEEAPRPAQVVIAAPVRESSEPPALPSSARVAPPQSTEMSLEAESAAASFAISPAEALVATWLAVSACWLVVAVVRVARFARVLSRARAAPAEIEQEVNALAGKLGVGRVPQVRIVDGRVGPLVWALFGRPVILLPKGLLDILSIQQRSTLLVHELAHLARRDHLARIVELAAVCLYWWHPVAWWARRNAQQAAEHCCDAAVVTHLPGAARAYAEALVATVDFLCAEPQALPLGASGFSQLNHVKRRMEMILTDKPARSTGRLLRLFALAAALVVLPLSLRALWAEPTEDAREAAAEQPGVDVSGEGLTEPSAIEKRLERLEKMIEQLHAQLQAMPSREPSVAEPARERVEIPDENDVHHALVDVVREAVMTLELNKTSGKRLLAAERQAQAVSEAFEAKTVAIDQLLEAQRRLAEAQMTYSRTSANLATDPARRDFLRAAAALHISNRARDEAHKTWKRVMRDPYVAGQQAESPAAAQAREQYFQFGVQAATLRREFEQAAARLKSSSTR